MMLYLHGTPSWQGFRWRYTVYPIKVASRTWKKQTVADKTEEQQEHGCPTEPQEVSALDKTCYYHSRLKADCLEGTPKALSLKEALELFRPDFISRSQGRVKRLEQRAKRRRALQDSNPDPAHGPRKDCGKQKRNCTTPDPRSNNLFKPRERSISGREMQLRSRRIYSKLPEVTKKKEEEKKRAVSQTNRLRAEVFKKRLLDQILQR
ncbi:(E2-independent) E3 ubiquitin-conjugating enzyme FATS-like [Toxotes jaculatrix]|uniref:(E2-independent) E3 ubiquitin-conjugating enzyme FATS-like n=1 Tax=Toxotes jaculatrix TaxID=941984 RepID=UPI001B3B1A42|nr:(E2-independent) E3 ubiquitin-conjugating enzyme FATS-like [Toxotes jaculatrix]